MKPNRPVLRIGLTGGIASGKTTVRQILAELGAYVLDADDLVHELMQPGGAAYDPVLQRFGRGILDSDGAIDRTALGRIVFHDADERAALNAIVHPLVRTEADRRMNDEVGYAAIAVFDAALLVESGAYRHFDRLIVLSCSVGTQLQRLVAREGISVVEAQARITAQAPLSDKLAVADYVIDTGGTIRETREQTDKVFADLVANLDEEYGSS